MPCLKFDNLIEFITLWLVAFISYHICVWNMILKIWSAVSTLAWNCPLCYITSVLSELSFKSFWVDHSLILKDNVQVYQSLPHDHCQSELHTHACRQHNHPFNTIIFSNGAVYMEKQSGPNREPCGIPSSGKWDANETPLTTTDYERLVNYN